MQSSSSSTAVTDIATQESIFFPARASPFGFGRERSARTGDLHTIGQQTDRQTCMYISFCTLSRLLPRSAWPASRTVPRNVQIDAKLVKVVLHPAVVLGRFGRAARVKDGVDPARAVYIYSI